MKIHQNPDTKIRECGHLVDGEGGVHGVDGGGGGLDEGAAAPLLDLPPLQRVKQRAHRVSEKIKNIKFHRIS